MSSILLSVYTPISYIFKLILITLGWSLITQKQLETVKRNNKTILLFSHTSYFDFWILILFTLAQPEILEDVYVVMKPQPFSNPVFKFFLELFHCIPASRLEDRGSGFVERTVSFLKDKEKFHLLMSPSGTIKANPWRSGYYYIAKGTDAAIMVVGFDYEDKCLSIGNASYHSVVNDIGTYENFETYLKKDMGQIIPYNPDNSSVELLSYDSNEVGFVNWITFSSFMTNFIILYHLYYFNKILFLSRLVLFSFDHHFDDTYYKDNMNFITVISIILIRRLHMTWIKGLILIFDFTLRIYYGDLDSSKSYKILHNISNITTMVCLIYI